MPVDATEPTGLAAHLPAGTHLGSQVWRYDRGPLACALLLALVGAAANLMVPWLVQRTIGAFTEHRPLGALVTVMAVSAVGGAIASSCSGYLLARVGERLILRLRCQVMTHILRLPISVVRRHGTGNLVARVTADATRLRSVIDVGVVQLPLAILTVCATIVAMALLDGTLVLLTLASFTVAATGIGLILKHVRRNAIAQQNATGALAHRFTAHLAALVTIKAYRAEARIGERLGDDAAQVTRTSMAGARLLSLITPVMGLGQQTAMVVVILGGGARLVDGTLSTGSFAAFLLYLLQLVGPVTLIATGVGRLQSGIAARVRFDELLAIPTEFDHGLPNALAKAETDAPAVSFRLVSLHHTDAAVPALKDVSFTLPRTGLTALVGPSGAGKSTALALVEGFLDPDGGEVHVLGRNVRDWPLADLRRHIAYVDQQFTLVEDTVRENLLLGHDDPVATSRLRGALESVGLLSDIDALPKDWRPYSAGSTTCPEGNDSASRRPVRSSPMPRWSSWTNPHPSRTASTSSVSGQSWTISPPPARCSSSLTACPPSATRIRCCCSTRASSTAPTPTRASSRTASATRSSSEGRLAAGRLEVAPEWMPGH